MSRHRFYQNAADEYSDDENYSYGSSYGTSYEDGLSKSVEEQYMYNRNQGGHTPKVSSFLTQITSASGIPAEQAEFEMDLEIGSAPQGPGFQMDIDTGPPPERGAIGGGDRPMPIGGAQSLRRQDSGYDTSGLGLEDQMKLNNGLDYIQNIVGDTISENLVKEYLVVNNFDAEKALALLLDRGQGSSSKNPPNTLQIQPVVKMPSLPKSESVISPSIVKPVSTPTAIGNHIFN